LNKYKDQIQCPPLFGVLHLLNTKWVRVIQKALPMLALVDQNPKACRPNYELVEPVNSVLIPPIVLALKFYYYSAGAS
jgi:hypothetical protein